MSDLPVNVDSTYQDDPDDPSRALHQQHHDSLHTLYNELKGSTAVSAALRAKLDDYFLLLAGGTMTGALVLSGDPAVALGAATKQYVDASSSSAMVGARAIPNAATTLTSGTFAAVALAAEDFDTDAFHDNATNNSRLTVPAGKGGKFRVSGAVGFAVNGTGQRLASIYKNGAEVARAGGISGGGVELGSAQVEWTGTLAATDYVQLFAYQTSTVNLDTTTNGVLTSLTIARIGA